MKRWSVNWKNADPTWRGPRAGVVHVDAVDEAAARLKARERCYFIRLRHTKILSVKELADGSDQIQQARSME